MKLTALGQVVNANSELSTGTMIVSNARQTDHFSHNITNVMIELSAILNMTKLV